jgi:hypothetical protein
LNTAIDSDNPTSTFAASTGRRSHAQNAGRGDNQAPVRTKSTNNNCRHSSKPPPSA